MAAPNMRPSFELAFPIILEHEGHDVFTNDPDDPGGATRWGISLRYLRARGDLDHDGILDGDVDGDGDVDAADLRAMPRDEASRIYESGFWKPNRCSELETQDIANKVVDTAVNIGSKQTWVLAQRACWTLSRTDVVIDGKLGRQTLAAVNSFPAGVFLPKFCAEQRAYYELIITRKPKLIKYRRGWTRRAAWPYTTEYFKWLV